MTQLLLNIPASCEARDKGIKKAMDSADRNEPGWNEKAYEMFVSWLSGWPKGYCFQIEDFRASASARGLTKPKTDRAFGGVAVKAKNAGLIRSTGAKPTKGVTGHRCNANLWEKI